jgi:hypothetical protein
MKESYSPADLSFITLTGHALRQEGIPHCLFLI